MFEKPVGRRNMIKQNSKKEKKTVSSQKFGVVGYPVGDFLIRIKNAAMARQKTVVVRKTNFILALAKALKKESFLDSVESDKDIITVSLTIRKKESLIMGMKLISKPGQRRYMGIKDLLKIKRPSTFFISTPKGILSSREAIKAGLGGEVIVEVW